MILAELDSPLIALPWVHDFFRESFDSDQPPYSRARPLHDWAYGDSVNSDLSQQRLSQVVGRTGREIFARVIPEKTAAQIQAEKCWLCHEVSWSWCLSPGHCPSSFYNPLCGHADNAGVYPGIEALLHILHIWGVVTEDDFIEHSAWLRIISRKLFTLDVIARWDDFSCLAPGSQDDKYFQVFGTISDESNSAQTTQEKIDRNIILQERLSLRILPYLDQVQWKIRHAMTQEWLMKPFLMIDQDIAQRIRSTIEDRFHQFWTMDFPR